MARERKKRAERQINGRGYILDEPYVSRYYDLQSPARMAYSIRSAGFTHATAEKPFRYCELGCGNGVTLVMLGALYPESTFVGVDLNPEHIENAIALAKSASVSNVSFLQGDFSEAAAAGFLPFDYITVHGVYSWVDAHTKETMFCFIRDFLADDGIAYISYNAFPGWSAKEPIWRLLNRYSKRVDGNSVQKISEGLRFLDFLSASDAPYFQENPSAREHLEFLKSEDLNYASHEFCNDNFCPVYCSEIFDHARKFGLQFLAQAETVYNIGFERVSPQYRDFIASLGSHEEREVWISLLRNDFFRTDLYARQLPKLESIEESSLWRMGFMLIVPIAELPATIECGSKQLERSDPLISAMITAATETAGPLADFCRHPALRRFPPRLILETAQLLELSGCFAFLIRRPTEPPSKPNGDWRFASPAFSPLLRFGLRKNQVGHLPAPNIGSTLRFDVLAALALAARDGHKMEDAAHALTHVLNEDFPELLGSRITDEWAEGYITDLEARWLPILLRTGSVK